MDQQSAMQYAKGMMDAGMSAADANVEVVRMMGVRVVSTLTKDVRSALMAGVKDGRIGRVAKKGHAPEVFHHPNARGPALDAQAAAVRRTLAALAAVVARPH